MGWLPPGAGRKLTPGRRPVVPHRARPPHNRAYPVHVTLRARIALLRTPSVFPVIRRALTLASRNGFRLVQFSVQDNHVHLIVEADHGTAFRRGIRGLAIRAARAVNRVLGRHGPVWEGRYHSRPLTTSRAVRHALVYVLMNRRKHQPGEGSVDPCSSAPWFDGWRERIGIVQEAAPVARARTWLGSLGWRRHGLIGLDERPRGGG